MMDEVDELTDAYEKLEDYYLQTDGEIDPEIFASIFGDLQDEMKKAGASDDDICEMKNAVAKLESNESDKESSASARGQFFKVVTDAFKLFVAKPNIRLVARRAGEEIYSELGERLIEQNSQSRSTEESTASQRPSPSVGREHAGQASTGEMFIKNIHSYCTKT